jgi:DNA-binding transcriptional LysR family regulator
MESLEKVREKMDLNHLEYFVAISEEKNISRAAEKLFVSQPTLSRYLLTLEEELGTPLFNRIKNSLILTYAGEVYLDSAKEILNIQKQTHHEIEDIIDFKKGHISIGIPAERGATIIPSVFPLFHEKYPGIEIDFIEDSTSNLELLTLQGHIDFSIIVHYGHETQLDYEVLCHEEFILAVPKSHRLANLFQSDTLQKRPVVDLALFKNEPFILMKPGTKNRKMTDDIFKDAGFSPKVFLETLSIYTVQNTAATGVALALLPEKMINYAAVGDRLVYFSINPEKYYWPHIATFRRNSFPTRASRDFIAMAKSHLISITASAAPPLRLPRK